MQRLIAICVIMILAVFFHYLWYMGIFSNHKVAEGEFGPYKYVYETHIGPYSDTGKVFNELYKSLKDDGIDTVKGIGIYYDNPGKVQANKLRSECGAIISELNYDKLDKIKDKYKVKELKEGQYIYSTFPIKNSLSYMIGPMLIYPKLHRCFDKELFKDPEYAVEIYDEPYNIIYYAIPLQKK